MAKHRQIPRHSLHARTVIGGVLASGTLLVGAPAGMALAHHGTNDTNPPKPALSTSSASNAKENAFFYKLEVALGTKAATDPGLAKLLGAVGPLLPKCLGGGVAYPSCP